MSWNADFKLPRLRRDEWVSLKLRALFEREGYSLYRMGSFEEYDLYMQNKPLLTGEDIITFTAADGRLMALKPDVTLSIVKNTPAGEVRRIYYNEEVFRRSRQSGEYREIRQMGLEFIGGEGHAAEAEVLKLAVESLALQGEGVLDLSHMGVVEAILRPFGEDRGTALDALRDKSAHGMLAAAKAAGVGEDEAQKLAALAALSGPCKEVLPKAKQLIGADAQANAALDELGALCTGLDGGAGDVAVRVDFSILNDVGYYNGLIFQGYVNGISAAVLAGGRYDNLLQRFNKPQGAVGFALYLDALAMARSDEQDAQDVQEDKNWLNIALPKGRMGDAVYQLFEARGISYNAIVDNSRKLVFEDAEKKLRFFMVKPTDVAIYVEHGAADIGVVGKDVLMEDGADVIELLDLGLGKCRLAVAGRVDFTEDPARALRVATKYTSIARSYYAAKSRSVEIIELHGSIELAPLLGLADVIVDIVETGTTLKENDLMVLEEIAPSSARLIANRASWRFKEAAIWALKERLGA